MIIVLIILLIVMTIIMLAAVSKKKGGTHKASANQMSNQPLYTISKKGFLGFEIGDSFEFVWSRIIHLNLMTAQEIDKYQKTLESMSMLGFGLNKVTVARNKYADIDYISLSFDSQNSLDNIMVYIKNRPDTMVKDYMKNIKDKYVNVLGEPNMVNSAVTYQWLFNDVLIVLGYLDNNVILHIHN